MESTLSFLDAKAIKNLTGLGIHACYELFDRSDFPTIKIGKRKLTTMDLFKEWCEKVSKNEVATGDEPVVGVRTR